VGEIERAVFVLIAGIYGAADRVATAMQPGERAACTEAEAAFAGVQFARHVDTEAPRTIPGRRRARKHR
jgi:hypothetical protein